MAAIGTLIVFDGISVIAFGNVAESAEQDQTARKCSLILLYTLLKINTWSQTARIRVENDYWGRTQFDHRSKRNT